MSTPRLSVSELNALPAREAERVLESCCGASAWMRRMAAGRPFADRDALLRAADAIWRSLSPGEWREAFDHHPRIGERRAAAAAAATAGEWSKAEQAHALCSDAGDRAALADAQREYEARFGHIFLVCAAGRGSAELLANLRGRLRNLPDAELRVAAEEQRKITRLRLDRVIADSEEHAS